MSFHTKAIALNGSTKYLLNSTGQSIGIANAYTENIWLYINSYADFKIIFEIGPTSGSNNLIRTTTYPTGCYINDTYSNTAVEVYRGTANSTIAAGSIIMLTITWDGTNLVTYKNGVPDTTKGNAGPATFIDSNRGVGVGTTIVSPAATLNANVAKVDIWNTALSSSEITSLYASGLGYDLDTRNSYLNYTSQANLKHQWCFGKDSANIGADYVSSGNIDLMANAVNVSSSDIVTFGPGIPGKTISVSDSFTLSESTNNLRARLLSVSDTVTLSNVVTVAKATLISVSDTIGLSDGLSFVRSYVLRVSDAIGLSETIKFVVPNKWTNKFSSKGTSSNNKYSSRGSSWSNKY